MQLELKSIRHSPSLSSDSEAFTANLYVNGKKAGYAKDDGNGGCIMLRIDKNHVQTMHANARCWLDILDPNPIDLSKPWPKPGEQHARLSVLDRKQENPETYLGLCVGILLRNHLIIKQVKKAQSCVSWLTTECEKGQYIRMKQKPAELTPNDKKKIESEAVFCEWLFDKDHQYIANRLGYLESGDGPLITAAIIVK